MLISSTAWNEVRARYEKLGSNHAHSVAVMMRLLDWIRAEGLEEELFPHTSMFDLVLSDRPEVRSGENTLRVSVSLEEKTVTFRYDRLYGSADSAVKSVAGEDSVEVLREFLAYKFGVYRKKKEPNQAPEPTAPSGRGSS